MYREVRALFIVDLPINPDESSSLEDDLRDFNFLNILHDTMEANLADVIKVKCVATIVLLSN